MDSSKREQILLDAREMRKTAEFLLKAEERKQYRRQYYQKNKEKILLNANNRYKETKHLIDRNEQKKYNAQYYKNNYNNEYIMCECGGGGGTKNSIKLHYKSQFHQDYIANKEIVDQLRMNCEQIICVCGSTIAKYTQKIHNKTKIHKDYIANHTDTTIKEATIDIDRDNFININPKEYNPKYMQCGCGASGLRHNMWKHLTSLQHREYIANQSKP